MIVLYFCLLGAVWGKQDELEKMKLTPKNIPKFPFQMDKPFEVIFKTNAANGILNKALIDTMVIHIPNPEGLSETAVFDFGFKDSIDSEFVGLLMRIPKWDLDAENEAIRAKILFTKYADNKWLEIYHISVDTSKERRAALSNLKLLKPLYREKIILMIPQKIEMWVNSVNTSVVELSPDIFYKAACRTYGGVYNFEPTFLDLPPKSSQAAIPGRIESTFKVSIIDDGRNLTCRAGSTEKHVTLRVLHGPTKIQLEPNITSTIGNGSSVVCRAADGYPRPKSSWHFLDGPPYAERYYIISYDKQSIYFKSNTPIGSKWNVKCMTWNAIKGKQQYYQQNFKFIITHVNQYQNVTMMEPMNATIRWDKLEKEGNCSKCKDIVNMKKQIEKQTKEISKLKVALAISKSEVSKLKSSLKRLTETQGAYNSKLIKLKRYIDEKITTLKKEFGNSIKEGKQEIYYSTKKNQIRSTPIPTIIQPFLWKITNVVLMRKRRKVIRSKKVYLNKFERGMILILYFNDPRYLRLNIQMYPTMNIYRHTIMKGSFNITIADAENETSKIMTEKRFEIGSGKTRIDVFFEYIELFNRQILQSDEIEIKVVGFVEN